METRYQPQDLEARAYACWERLNLFEPRGDGDTYCIILPPPNVTGTLHMGHAFQATIMDCLCRYRRLLGDRVLWQPGTDHAGIATQIVVATQMAREKQQPSDIGREAFIDKVWAWKEKSGGTISAQLRRLGASLDWKRECFTMDAELSEAVCEAFVRLYDADLIYRGKRLINWDPVMQTAVSDLEVVAEEEQGHLWDLRYPIKDSDKYLVVATTRPETMFGDTAVAVHPDDERYRQDIGKVVRLPLTERDIPIIADEHVDMAFGTGCVKVTPAHDFNDYQIGLRHELPSIEIFNANATLNDAVPKAYRNLDRYVARERVVADLRERELLHAVRDHKHTVPRGERSGQVLEPRLSDQWFIRTEPLAEEAMRVVKEGRVEFIPANWSATYFEWLNNIQDWCISRQIWWGHQIPAWYDNDGRVYVARSKDEVYARYRLSPDTPLRRDDDVLDTWFSSSLWPFTTMGWPHDTPELKAFYPGNALVTGFDIIFFWVARMIMMGLQLTQEIPFKQVYVHGLVRDAYGQKMSKSKGNTLDPIDLIDGVTLETLVEKRLSGVMQERLLKRIESDTRKQFPEGIQAYGTDAVRFTFMSLASTGRDVRFDLGRLEGYRNFCNKLWNAARYVINLRDKAPPRLDDATTPSAIDTWIQGRLGALIEETKAHYENYRFDLLAQALYTFIWHDYCDWFLEFSKVAQREGDASAKEANYACMLDVLKRIIVLLHPIAPFITEEIWSQLRALQADAASAPESILQLAYPEAIERTDEARRTEEDIEKLRQTIGALRRTASELNIAQVDELPLSVQFWNTDDRQWFERHERFIRSLCRVSEPQWLAQDEPVRSAALAVVRGVHYFISVEGLVDIELEYQRLTKETRKIEKQLAQLRAQIDKPGFADKAPAHIIQTKRQQIDDSSQRLDELKRALQFIK